MDVMVNQALFSGPQWPLKCISGSFLIGFLLSYDQWEQYFFDLSVLQYEAIVWYEMVNIFDSWLNSWSFKCLLGCKVFCTEQ